MTYGYRYSLTSPILELSTVHSLESATAYVQRRREHQLHHGGKVTVELVSNDTGEWKPIEVPPIRSRTERRAIYDPVIMTARDPHPREGMRIPPRPSIRTSPTRPR